METIEGLLHAYINLDRIISIIREKDEPKKVIIQEFDLSELQAEAILNLRLRALRRLDEELLLNEQQELMKERQVLEDLLEDQGLQWKKVKNELSDLKQKFSNYRSSERLTSVEPEKRVLDYFPKIQQKNFRVTIVLSENGWIRSYKGHES